MLAGATAFGQGYLNFASAKSQVWVGGVIGGGAASTASVSFLWGSQNLESAIQALTGLNGSPNTTAPTNYPGWGGSNPNAAAWSAILTDPNFVLAVNSTSSSTVMQPVIANGSFTYGNVPLVGSTADTTIYLYEIAWVGGGAPGSNPNAGLGWGNVFSYALTASTEAAHTITGANQIGVGSYQLVPEPTTLALAGLGSLGLLLFRRRK